MDKKLMTKKPGMNFDRVEYICGSCHETGIIAHRVGRAPAARCQRLTRPDTHSQENTILTAAPELAEYIAGLKQRSRKVIMLALRQLLRCRAPVSREPLFGAAREVARYGLYNLVRAHDSTT
jgi:hypothetical protein